MKKTQLTVAVLLLGGAIGFSGTPAHSAGAVISKIVSADGTYCHIKFAAMREATLDSPQPVLKDVDDIVDFYGPCSRDSLGKDEIQAQKLEEQHRFSSTYDD